MTRKTSEWAAIQAINAATVFLARNAAGNGRIPYETMLAFIQANSSGTPGKNPQFQTASGYVQWRLTGDTTWNNLYPLSDVKGADGLGVPTGGATGQILAKKSGTANDTQWIDAPTGGGAAGAVLITSNQSIAGLKKFTDVTEFAAGAGLLISTLQKLTPAPTTGSTVAITAGVSYQQISPAADLAALTIQLPDWTTGGFILNIITTKRVAAVTFLGGVHNAGTSVIVGAPAALEVGITSLHFFIADNTWFFYK